MENRKILVGCAAAMLYASCSVAMAESPSWNYVSAAWVLGGDFKEDAIKEGLDGYQVSAVKSLGNMFFMNIGATNTHFDFGGIHNPFAKQQIGAGARFTVAKGIDLWGSLNYDRVEYYEGAIGNGFGIDIGVRALVTNALELGFTYKHSPSIDFDAVDAELTGYELSGVYNVSPKTGILLTYASHELKFDNFPQKDEWDGVIGLGVRLAF